MNNFSNWVFKDIVQGRLEIDDETNEWRVHLYTEQEADDINTYYEFISHDLSKRGRPVEDEADICSIYQLSRTEFVSKIFCEAPKSTTRVLHHYYCNNNNGCLLAELEILFSKANLTGIKI